MIHAFGGSYTSAKLQVEFADGSQHTVDFDTLHSLDIEHGIQETWLSSSRFKQYEPTGVITVKLVGRATTVTVTEPAQKADAKKPFPKQPSLRASTLALQKATQRELKAAIRRLKATKEMEAAEADWHGATGDVIKHKAEVLAAAAK